MIILHVESKCVSGILLASNMSNREFTYFFLHKGDFGPLPTFLILPLRLSVFFYLHCLGLESSSNIILQHVFSPTFQNLHVRALQGQLSRLQAQLSFRYREHLIKPLNGVHCAHNMQPLHKHCCFVPT